MLSLSLSQGDPGNHIFEMAATQDGEAPSA